VLYSELGHEAPFIASMILSAIDLVMRLVIVERSSAPAEWFTAQDSLSKHKVGLDTQDQEDIELKKHIKSSEQASLHPHVTWCQLLKQPRLIVSLGLTAVVATVMSAFEVSFVHPVCIFYPSN
jgi:hypothetical protein